MNDTSEDDWEKELRILLDLIQSRPSQDWARERDRIVVLNNLIATRRNKPDS